MAKVLSREFRDDLGAVVVRIQAEGGPVEVHTLYVLAPGGCPACGGRGGRRTGVLDVEAEIAARLADAETRRAAIAAAFAKAGRT